MCFWVDGQYEQSTNQDPQWDDTKASKNKATNKALGTVVTYDILEKRDEATNNELGIEEPIDRSRAVGGIMGFWTQP